jgi:hypothetical protein
MAAERSIWYFQINPFHDQRHMVPRSKNGFALNEKTLAELNRIEFSQGVWEYKFCFSQATPKAKFKKQEVYFYGD